MKIIFLELQNYGFFIRNSTINHLYIEKAGHTAFYLHITNKKFLPLREKLIIYMLFKIYS